MTTNEDTPATEALQKHSLPRSAIAEMYGTLTREQCGVTDKLRNKVEK